MASVEEYIQLNQALPEYQAIRDKRTLPIADVAPSSHVLRRARPEDASELGISLTDQLFEQKGITRYKTVGPDQISLHYIDSRKYAPESTREVLLLSMHKNPVIPEIMITPEEWDQLEKDEYGLPKAYLVHPEAQFIGYLQNAEALGRLNSPESIQDLKAHEQLLREDKYPKYPNRSHDVLAEVVVSNGPNETPRSRAERALHEPWRKNLAINDITFDRQGHPDKKLSRRNPRKFGIRGVMGRQIRDMHEMVDMATGAITPEGIAMQAMMGRRVTITRSGLSAYPEVQLAVAQNVFNFFDNLDLSTSEDPEFLREYFKSNVALAIDCNTDLTSLRNIDRFLNMGGTSITNHTIAPDESQNRTAQVLRKEFGWSFEYAAGVLANTDYAKHLIGNADIIKFGHGPGTRCQSAIVGRLKQNALEQLVRARGDKDFNDTTIVLHVGSSDNPAVPLYFGGGVGYVRVLSGTSIEKSLILLRTKDGKYVLQNSGDASEDTTFGESSLIPSKMGRYDLAGSMEDPEGVLGYAEFNAALPAMGGKSKDVSKLGGNMLGNCGVSTLAELYGLLDDRDFDIAAIESITASNSSQPNKNTLK
jgi:hypothetical protein